jgi:hypothetical protein
MATVHSQQLARKLFPKLTCSTKLPLLLFTTVLLSGAFYHNLTTCYDKLVPTNFLNRLFATGRNEKVETAILTKLPSQGRKTMAKRSFTKTGMEAIQKGTKLLQQQLVQALAKIKQNVQKNKDLAEWISRSPRAIKTIQALEAAIAIFDQTKPNPIYEVSKYATGNKRWKRSPAQHPVPIQDLLLYDVQAHQEKNKILGEKVAKVVEQNLHLAQQASRAYETPSERLKKDPIMGLVTNRGPPTCSSSITMSRSRTTTWRRMTFHHGDNHFSKRRSDSKKEGNQKSESQKRKLKSKRKVGQQVKERQK